MESGPKRPRRNLLCPRAGQARQPDDHRLPRPHAVDYSAPRGLDRQPVRPFAKDSAGVRQHQNLFLIGLAAIGTATERGESPTSGMGGGKQHWQFP